MKQFFTPLIFCLLFSTSCFAQQGIQYSMYMLNKYSYNPAYAGLDNSLSVTTVLRKQWAGLPGSPTTQQVNMHLPLYIAGGGLGLKMENDMIGLHRQTSATISYAYHMPIGKTSLLSLSAGGGIVQRALDGSGIITPTGIYGPDPGPINHNDNFLPIGTASAMAPTALAGIYFYSESLEVGIAADNLLESTFNYLETGNEDYRLKRNYYFLLAYNLNLAQRFVLSPSVFVKSDISQTQIDFSMLVHYNDNIFGGASFRGYNSNSIDAVVFVAGSKLSEKLTLAYSYDMTLSTLSSSSSGSHELMLNYNLNKTIGAGVPQKIIYNPRFL